MDQNIVSKIVSYFILNKILFVDKKNYFKIENMWYEKELWLHSYEKINLSNSPKHNINF